MPSTLTRKVRILFGYDPFASLKAIMPRLRKLAEELRRLENGEGINQIVPFFNLVSPWQDEQPLGAIRRELEEFDTERYSEVIEDLRVLTLHFTRAGRDQFGWNRTERGQVVTDHDVYLGNIYGLFTKTVAFWKARKDEPKGGFAHYGGNMGEFNAYDVVSDQARQFMNSHIRPMCKIIERLARAVA